MAKKRKNKRMNILKDWKHWLGWGITTTALFGVFLLLPGNILTAHTSIFFIILAVVVLIDLIKHKTGLQ